jgi:Carboxypeptidase regulatory-like domain
LVSGFVTQFFLLLLVGLSATVSGARIGHAQNAPPTAASAGAAHPLQTPHNRGGISGRILDLQSGAPIRDARIALLGTTIRTATDTGGRFTVDSLRSGTYVLQARAIGYRVTVWVVPLRDGELIDKAFELPPIPDTLAAITVEGQSTFFERRMREFEERRRARRGVFVTEDEIHASGATTLVDVLRGIPGVLLSCRLASCVVEMTRSAQGICRADWVVDGFPATESGTPHLPVTGIVGIEIYRSPGETPAQFLKADSQCGVIAIWTKSGPR